MDIRQALHSDHFKTLDTQGLRDKMLVTKIMVPGQLSLTYSHVDRIIVGGAVPTDSPLTLSGGKELGVDYFLERREMGVINIGAPGRITVDGETVELGTTTACIFPKRAVMSALRASMRPSLRAFISTQRQPMYVTSFAISVRKMPRPLPLATLKPVMCVPSISTCTPMSWIPASSPWDLPS
ncbi:hypothetical protein HSBAA_22530 [Vreelandella sulfidaeris]|uniref:5-dehydro-4-deoxy-D-glucuronate isomerase n=1 Tax=Vreelandella sulfidaeris TaxID=115553 RepID=A0A455U5Z9_9GAMM|nr:hypothetical protein HSBAA_22530 [Halomonas sulfidaeris]